VLLVLRAWSRGRSPPHWRPGVREAARQAVHRGAGRIDARFTLIEYGPIWNARLLPRPTSPY